MILIKRFAMRKIFEQKFSTIIVKNAHHACTPHLSFLLTVRFLICPKPPSQTVQNRTSPDQSGRTFSNYA
jgi:hypothetical protein